jgi:hypothetical protein
MKPFELESNSTGDNLSPMAPLRQNLADKARDKTVQVKPDWFKEIKQQLEDENADIWRNQRLLWQMLFLMIEGKQLLRQSNYGRGWRAVPLPRQTDEPVYAYNVLGFYSDGIKAKWSQSRTDIVWRASNDSDQSIGAAKVATMVHDYYGRKLYTPTFLQTEAMLAQCGKYARYYYYSDEAERKGRFPVTETQQVAFGESTWMCPECGDGGAESELMQSPDGVPTCPACGSPFVEVQPVEPLEVEAVTGYEEKNIGDIVVEAVPAFELKHDLGKSPQESPFLIRKRRVRLSLLEAQYPELKLRSSKSDDSGLDAAEALRNSTFGAPSAYVKQDTGMNEPVVDYIQMWLDPAMYANLSLSQPFSTVTGIDIPAGTPLIELFPVGLYSAWIQGVDGCVELRNEHHKDFFVGQVYRMRALSSLGTGIEDMVEGQRQYNLIMSIIYTQLRTSAMPATLFDERLLPNGVSSYLGSLQNIPVNLSALDGATLQNAVHQLQPQPPTGQHFNFAQQLDYFIQKASRVTDFSGGLPGVNNETATGAEIAQATSQSLFGPQLALKADVDRRGAEILLRLFRDYTFQETFVHLAGKRGEIKGQWFSQADLDGDLFAEVVPESYLPQTNLERRQRWRSLLMDLGGLPGLKLAIDQMPALVEQLTELYDVDLGASDFSNVVEIAQLRIRQMEEALPMVSQMASMLPPSQVQPDPMTGEPVEVPTDPMAEMGQLLLQALVPPVEMEELGHQASINYLRDWLTTDAGIVADPMLRGGVKAMIGLHLQGMMMEAQIGGALGTAGEPPLSGPEDEKKPESGNARPPREDREQSTKEGTPRPQPNGKAS